MPPDKKINDERSHGKSRKNKYDDDPKTSKESSHRKIEGGDRRDRDKERKDLDRDKRDRNDDDRKHREDRNKDSDRKRRDDTERRYKDEGDKERRRDKGDDREKRHRDTDDRERRHKEGDSRDRRDRDEREKRHRNDEREKRHRDGDREKRHKDDDRERRHKDDDREKKHRDDEREKRRRDDERERGHKDSSREKSHRDDDREKKRRDDDREKKYRDDNTEKRHRDDERERRHRDSSRENRNRDGADKDRRRRDGDEKREKDDREKRHRDGDNRDRERKHREDDSDKRLRDGDGKDKKRHDRDDRDRKHRDGDGRDHKRIDGEEEKDNRNDYKESRHRKEDELALNNKQKDKMGTKSQEDEEEYLVQSGGKNSQRAVSSKGKKQSTTNDNAATGALSGKSKVNVKEVEEGDEYGGYGDDDFEDYDEDFEDDDGVDDDEENGKFNKMTNNEMEELYDALNAENERLLASSRKSFDSDDTESSYHKPAASKPRSFINFVAAKQRDMNQKAASKARKRCTELLNIIELDTIQMTLFDLPPVKEYDLYMSSFGRTNAQQVYIQTNDDNLERDTQTEDIDVVNRWTQHPQESATACGIADNESNSEKETAMTSKHDEGRLESFLQRACQVVERLIGEEHAKSSYTEKCYSFSSSEGFVSLRNVEIFDSRRVSSCLFSPTDSAMLLTIHTEPTKPVDKKLDKYGMIGVWNTNDPTQPQKIVASASMPSCCCFSPIKATLVFGGMRDGSLVAWDLREAPTMHHSYICGGKDWLLRFPTYNTAGVLKYDNHNSPITALVPVLTDTSKSASQESGLGLSFQLATLERNGIIHLWVVAEILETSMAGSESDLGLSPNGKIKLIKSSSISLTGSARNDLNQSLCTLDLKLNPSNHNHFYVATDAGTVLHGTRFGTQKTIPRCYRCDDATPCVVTAVDLHPFGHPVLLAGCEDGSIRLHQLSSESPIIVWESSTNGSAIRRVLWSRSCSYIIFVLDSNSIIHMWDLLRNDAEPMASEKVSNSHSRAVDMCLSDESQTHSRPKMVVNYDDGSVQVHLLSSHVSNLQPGENEQFSRFVEQL